MDTYEAIVSRSGKFWHIEIAGLPMAMTQARRISEVEYMARDLVAALLDVPEESFALSVRFDGEVAVHAAQALEARAAAREATEQAEETTREAVRYLVGQGLGVRDVAALLHVSPGWVSVLARAERAA